MIEARKIGDAANLVYPVLGNLPGTKVEIVEVMNDGEPHELRGYLYRVKSTVNEKIFLQWENMIA